MHAITDHATQSRGGQILHSLGLADAAAQFSTLTQDIGSCSTSLVFGPDVSVPYCVVRQPFPFESSKLTPLNSSQADETAAMRADMFAKRARLAFQLKVTQLNQEQDGDQASTF